MFTRGSATYSQHAARSPPRQAMIIAERRRPTRAEFVASPAEPLFLSHGGFWSWVYSRLEKCARGGATPLSILRQQIGLLDALIRVAFQIVNSPWLLIQVLLAERPFFEYHGLGRPPRCLTAQTWTGLPQRNLRGMHSTRFVPA